jgi:hypothetical protein
MPTTTSSTTSSSSRSSGSSASAGSTDPQEELDAEQQELLQQQVALTRQVMAASSWQGLRALLDQQGGALNHVHLIAMISRLDTLQVEQRQQQQAPARGHSPVPQHSPQHQQQQQFLASGWMSPQERVQRNKLVGWLVSGGEQRQHCWQHSLTLQLCMAAPAACCLCCSSTRHVLLPT